MMKKKRNECIKNRYQPAPKDAGFYYEGSPPNMQRKFRDAEYVSKTFLYGGALGYVYEYLL